MMNTLYREREGHEVSDEVERNGIDEAARAGDGGSNAVIHIVADGRAYAPRIGHFWRVIGSGHVVAPSFI